MTRKNRYYKVQKSSWQETVSEKRYNYEIAPKVANEEWIEDYKAICERIVRWLEDRESLKINREYVANEKSRIICDKFEFVDKYNICFGDACKMAGNNVDDWLQDKGKIYTV